MPAPTTEPTNWEAIAAVVSAAIAVISALVSIYFAHRSQAAQSGGLELEIRASIRDTRARVRELSMANIKTLTANADNPDGGDPHYKAIKLAFDEAVEDNLNAYDEACAKYLDGKVDKTRFKKNYENEIRELFDAAPLQKFLGGKNSRFYNLDRVYKLWIIEPKS